MLRTDRPDGLEGHEPGSVHELVGDVGGELERQAGLSGATGAGQRQQAGSREETCRLGQLGIASDKARQLGRQVVWLAIQRTDRRKVVPEPLDDELALMSGFLP